MIGTEEQVEEPQAVFQGSVPREEKALLQTPAEGPDVNSWATQREATGARNRHLG